MSLNRDDPLFNADADVVPSPHDLADVASMANHELFTAVIASIRRDGTGGGIKNRRRKGGKKKKKKKNGVDVDDDDDDDDDDKGGGDGDDDDGARGGDGDRWRRVAISVAASAARGEEGCRSAGEWAGRFRSLLLADGAADGGGSRRRRPDGPPPPDDDGTAVASPPAIADFGEALRTLPAGECYRNRLRNALDSAAATNARDGDDDVDDAGSSSRLSVRRAAGLVRCAALLLDSESAGAGCSGGGIGGGDDRGLVARAMSRLVRSVPARGGRAGGGPPLLRGILLAVQAPLLRKMDWGSLLSERGGGTIDLASSSDAEVAEFRCLLDLDFDATARRDDRARRAGEKRKRIDPEGGGDGAEDATTDIGGCTTSRLLEAAHLARKGAVRACHGAVIYVPEEEEEEEDSGGGGGGTTTTIKTKVIGRGWNHDYFLDPSTSGRKNKIVLHSEVHAVADAICNYGEDECFERLFPRATIMIVELASDYAYDTCHPCPKCDPLLRAVGIPTVLHTTPHGRIEKLDLRPANAALLSNENVSIPLDAACRERNIACRRLRQKCEPVIEKGEDRR
jgi:hypothetical protein